MHTVTTISVPIADYRSKAARLLKAPPRCLSFLTLSALLALTFIPAPASAATRIGEPGSGPGQFANLQAVAVSASEGPGDIYTTDGRNNRVEQFEPDGTFVRAFGWGIVPGAASGHGNLTVGSTSITATTTTSGEFMPGQIITGPGIPSGDAISRVVGGAIDLTRPPTASASGAELKVSAGPGNVPTDEVQKLTVSATAGTFELSFESPLPDSTSKTTAAIQWNAPASGSASVQEALEHLPNIGSGNVSVTGGPGDEKGASPYLIEFKGRYADSNVRPLQVAEQSLTGGEAEAKIDARSHEGGGALETCTTVCWEEIHEQAAGGIETEPPTGSPGQMNRPDEIAVDNDPSSPAYGDVYVVDQHDFRVERYSPEGHFELMFGGGVDKGPHHPGNLCTAAYIAEGDSCGVGVPGTGSAFDQGWDEEVNNSIAVGPDGTVYVGDRGRIQEFEPGGTFLGEFVPPGEATVTATGNLTEGSPTVSSVSATSGAFAVGQPITGRGIPAATNILAVGSGTLTLSKPATVTESGVALSVTPQFVTALAIDSAGDIYERSAINGTVAGASGEVTQIPGVREYGPGPAHPFIRTFDAEEPSTEPTHIALDSQGDLFASDFDETFIRPSCRFSSDETCPEAPFRAFRPDGPLYSIFTSPDVTTPLPGFNPRSIAFGQATGKLYAVVVRQNFQYVAVLTPPVAGPPIVKSEESSDLEPATAVLHAIVNPGGFDTKYQVEYVTQAHFEHEGFDSSEKTPLKDLGAIIRDDPVSVPLSGLHPGTAYRWRVVASSECEPSGCKAEGERNEAGEEIPQTFTTLPAVSVRGLTTQTVGPELVTLKAEINPNNGTGTEYTFRYGETEAYAGGSLHGKLGLSGDFQPIRATFTALKPNTAYHYQLIVRNANGEERSADQAFTTELSTAEELAAEDCPNGSAHGEPNSTIREEDNSLVLPDCRAYEQASEPEKKGGSASFAEQTPIAPSGERVAYGSLGSFDGALTNQRGAIYIAHRTPTGWTTQPVIGRPAPSPTDPGGRAIFNPELDRWLFRENQGLSAIESEEEQSSSYFSMGLADGSYVLHASPVLAPLEGGPRSSFHYTEVGGASNDLSHLLIPTGSRLLAEDLRPDRDGTALIPPEADRLYEVTGAGSESPSLRLAAEVPLGLGGRGSGFGGTGGCFLDWKPTIINHARPISEDGSTVFYTAPIELAAGYECGEGNPNPSALFSRTAENAPVQLNAPPIPAQCEQPNPCATVEPKTPLYDGASGNGRFVWFTTTQPLINSDTDQTNDLYVAKLTENGELEELVQASAGQPTATHPTPGVGADVGEDGVSGGEETAAINQGVIGVSADGTHAAFESPAVLTEEPNALGQTAVQHANNFYVYDLTTGQTKFVTDLCSGPGQSGSEPAPFLEGEHNVTKQQSVPDPACPVTASNRLDASAPSGEFALWGHSSHTALGGKPVGQAKMTPDGNFLLFNGVGRHTPDDTDNQEDLFRYDFQTGELTRVSIGHRGNDGNGNDNAYPAEFAGDDPERAISADGSTIVFRTPAPLVSRDTNQTSANGACTSGQEILAGPAQKPTGCDIYEWEEDGHGTCAEPGGCVSLLSSGHAPNVGDTTAEIGESGHDIIFQTDRGLIPGDTDGVADIYDARVDGGFHPEHPQSPCTSPEACGEATTSPPPPPVLGTPGFVGPGNAATEIECAKGRHRFDNHGKIICVPNKSPKHHHHRKHKRSHRRGGK